MVLRPAVVVVARADRRHGRLDVRRRRRRAACRSTACSRRSSMPGADRARCSRSSSPAWRSSSSYRIVGRQRPGTVARGFRLGQIVSGGLLVARRTAPTTRRRRWASSSWRWSPTATCRPTPTRADLGHRVVGDRRSRSAPTSAAGGSSARWAPGSSRWIPAQGFAAQGAGAAVILSASHVGFPLSTTHVISGGDHGRRRGQAVLGCALGRGGQHRRSPGCSRSRRRPRSARSPTASTRLFGTGALGSDGGVDRAAARAAVRARPARSGGRTLTAEA